MTNTSATSQPQAVPIAASAPGGAPLEADPQHRLEEVLPDIVKVAQKVGGMKRLAEIVTALSEAR